MEWILYDRDLFVIPNLNHIMWVVEAYIFLFHMQAILGLIFDQVSFLLCGFYIGMQGFVD